MGIGNGDVPLFLGSVAVFGCFLRVKKKISWWKVAAGSCRMCDQRQDAVSPCQMKSHLSHEKKIWPYFPLNPDCLIGILIIDFNNVYYIAGQFFIPFIPLTTNQGPFFTLLIWSFQNHHHQTATFCWDKTWRELPMSKMHLLKGVTPNTRLKPVSCTCAARLAHSAPQKRQGGKKTSEAYTPWHENRSSQKDFQLPTIDFQVQAAVSFREGNGSSKLFGLACLDSEWVESDIPLSDHQ